MKLDITYQPSVEKTYVTPDNFFVVDRETGIGLQVIDNLAAFVARDLGSDDYTERGFVMLKRKLTPKMLVAFADAYRNRNVK